MSGEKADYSESLSEDGRRFTNEWFYKRMHNGEKLKRKWLMNSESERAIYCFPCIVFYYQDCQDSQTSVKNKPVIADPQKGFKDWKHLNRIIDYENSLKHKECYMKWKTFKENLSEGNTIDQELQEII